MQRILLTIERGLGYITSMAGWISGLSLVAMISLIFANMAARYLFGAGATWLQELEWYLLSLSVMTGIAYAMRHDDHVRVDVFSHRFSRIGKYWLDLVTMLVVALPVALLILHYAWPFVETSYLRGERSPNRGGMPWLFLPKSMLLVGFALIAAEALRQVVAIVRRLHFHYRSRNRREGRPSAS